MIGDDNNIRATRIGPYQYILPENILRFLTEDIICTVFPVTEYTRSKFDDDVECYLSLISEKIWVDTYLPQIESLNNSDPENRRYQRLAISHATIFNPTNGMLDLSSFKEFLNEDDLLLTQGELSVYVTWPAIR